MIEKNNIIDPIIHEASRLRIVAILNECEVADFNFILGLTGLTRGNLCVHISKLVDAGYVAEKKEFLNKKPHTEYNITTAGYDAYLKYQEDLKIILKPQLKNKYTKATNIKIQE